MRASCLGLALLFASLGVAVTAAVETGLWITAVDPETQLPFMLLERFPAPSPNTAPAPPSTPTLEITFSKSNTLQTMVGFGAGLPQSCAYVLQALKNRNASLYWEVMERLFGSGEDAIGMSFVRFPIGSCDFSIVEASYDDVPPGQTDYELAHFAVDPDSLLQFETLRDARSINPELVLMAAPWSAPAWLKVLGTMNGVNNSNTLLPTAEARAAYAAYVVKAVQAITDAGLTLDYLSLENEPLFGSAAYPGMFTPSDIESAIGGLVGPALAALGLENTKLLAYDHNWDNYTYPEAVMGSEAGGYFAGAAFHCYGGVMETAQQAVHAAFPDKELHVTECTGGYPNNTCNIANGMVDFGTNHEWDMSNILLGAAANWAQSGVKWIMALDEFCGPTLPQVSFTWGRPLVAIPSTAQSIDDVFFNQDFWSIGQMSKFVPRGAVRIESTQTGTANADEIVAQVFAFSDAGTQYAALVVLNLNHTTPVAVTVTESDSEPLAFTVPLWGTGVLVWEL